MQTFAFAGTRRTRPPAETWRAIRPLLTGFGITRVADVTGLDDLGIPVAMAVRPLARTLSVAQGKGADLDSARVSAAMEAIEVWHAERAPLPTAEHDARARDLELPYPLHSLEHHPGSLVTDRVRMDWVTAHCLVDGTRTLLPQAAVRLGRSVHPQWRLHLPSASTNGLASGNTRGEALVHALCEVIERDVLSAAAPTGPDRPLLLKPGDVADPHCADLLDRMLSQRCWVELRLWPNRFGLPVMTCHLWREDQSAVIVAGSGAHPEPGIALSRAITEAAQTRLTLISGTREDNQPLAYRTGPHLTPAPRAEPAAEWSRIADRHRAAQASDTEQAAALAAVVHLVGGHAPMAVDLTPDNPGLAPFTVVKVIAPGLRYTARHTVPRPRTAV